MDRLPSLALVLCFAGSSCASLAPRTQAAPATNELLRPSAPSGDALPTPYIPDPNAALPQIHLGTASHDPAPGIDRQAAMSAGSPWIRASHSAQLSDMLVASIGSGPETVLVLGNLAGDDRHAPLVMDRLIRQLASRNAAPNVRIALIRSPNPDGLAAGTRENARGVDLDRSFPRLTSTTPVSADGDSPASEAETKFLLHSFSQLKPGRILQLKCRDAAEVEVAAYAIDDGIRQICAAHRVRLRELSSRDLPSGSLAEFAVVRLQTPLIQVTLPNEARPDDLKLLLDLIRRPRTAASAAPPPPQESIPSGVPVAREPEWSGARLTGSLQTDSDGQAGFVELLPPPPHLGGSTADDPKYHELTPAP